MECNMAIEDVLSSIEGKWAFLVIGHLKKSPQRFNQLKRNLGSVSTQSLTNILRNLEENEIVYRQVFPTVPVSVEYSLTEKGTSLLAILKDMKDLGIKWKNSG
ncbi:helix-turn-helix domain-containing protein [Bacillus gobiensis]|uniref:winged helix-turn-helix transcriptional regulator n=1 Tax=Bacillus gobiensis TaxID=1441095 RepID=UPI003D20330A